MAVVAVSYNTPPVRLVANLHGHGQLNCPLHPEEAATRMPIRGRLPAPRGRSDDGNLLPVVDVEQKESYCNRIMNGGGRFRRPVENDAIGRHTVLEPARVHTRK